MLFRVLCVCVSMALIATCIGRSLIPPPCMVLKICPVCPFSVLKSEPHTVLACLGLAVYETVLARDPPFELQKVHVRLQQFTPLTPLKSLKSNLVGTHATAFVLSFPLFPCFTHTPCSPAPACCTP